MKKQKTVAFSEQNASKNTIDNQDQVKTENRLIPIWEHKVVNSSFFWT